MRFLIDYGGGGVVSKGEAVTGMGGRGGDVGDT